VLAAALRLSVARVAVIPSISMRHALLIALVVMACGTEDPGPTGTDPCVDRTTAAQAHVHDDGGGTYAGASCIDANCHRTGALGPNAPAYLVAGTVFKVDGVTPQAGVTVRMIPLEGGAKTTMVTDSAGNFLLPITAPSPLPAIPDVTACPNTRAMLESIPNPDYANCNERSCHSTTGPGPGPITLAD
jgi:hypothetical protein